jgi:tetratricopeptide (TPR) repeat protein
MMRTLAGAEPQISTWDASLLPAALLVVWSREPRSSAGPETMPLRAGVHWLRDDLCAVLPLAGDPSVFDIASTLATEILQAHRLSTGEAPCALILPGRVRRGGGKLALEPNPLVETIAKQRPALPPGTIVLTSHAALRMDQPRRTEGAGFLDSPTGERVPLARLLPGDAGLVAGRNPVLLRRRTPFLSRPALEETLASLPWRGVLTGPFGCGKSRGVWETLTARKIPFFWTTVRSARQGGASLAAQIVFRLLTSNRYEVRAHTLNALAGLGENVLELAQAPMMVLEPARLAASAESPEWMARLLGSMPAPTNVGDTARPLIVVDDTDLARPGDLAVLRALIGLPATETGPALLLVERSSVSLRESWPALPHLSFPPWTARELATWLETATTGLALPPGVRDALLAATPSCPFAAEELVLQLIQEGAIRQVYGSFFYGGSERFECHPSDRLILHTTAEIERSQGRLAFAALATAEQAMPMPFLAGLAAEAGEPLPPDWALRMVQGGWLREVATPWGAGFGLAIPALGKAIAATLLGATHDQLSQVLGRLLPGTGGAGTWDRYRLLAGTPQGPEALLAAVEAEAVPPEQLAEALKGELAALRERGGEPALELELLRHLLPVAHRLGRLQEHKADVDRARDLASVDPRRYLAFSALKAEVAELEGQFPEAEATIREVLARHAGDERATAMLVLRLGRILLRQERMDEAKQLLERALPALEAGGASIMASTCQFYLGNVAVHQGRFEEALALHEQALERRRHQGKPRSIGVSLSALGRVHLLLGRFPEALASYQQAEELFTRLEDDEERSYALLGTGLALSRIGDFAGASSPLRRALLLRERAANRVGEAVARLAVGENYLNLKQLDSALAEARRALFDLELLPGRSSVAADARQLVGRVLLALRRYDEASRILAEALSEHRRLGVLEAAALDLAWSLESALARQDDTEAQQLLDELDQVLRERASIGQREVLEYRMFRARRRLGQGADGERKFMRHLRRAYQELLRKASYLDQEKRHFFLFQVPEHQAILAAASEHGLSLPEIPLAPVS